MSEKTLPTSEGDHARSGEEDDNLARSTKKVKQGESIEATVVDESMRASAPTFKDMVMGGGGTASEADCLGQRERIGIDFTSLYVNAIKVSTLEERPCISISDEYRESMRSRWKNCLIVKLLGRSIGYKVLEEKLGKLWNPKGEWELVDLGNGYFLTKFSHIDDLEFALEDGPWVIFGHYLTVRRWQPEFRPHLATIDTTAVWVRFPGIPLEYYDVRLLYAMGNTLGRALKVDTSTKYASRGKFARVCVEIDLTKALTPRIWVDNFWQSVEYEGLSMMCFDCGMLGHPGVCPKVVEKQAREASAGEEPAATNVVAVTPAAVRTEVSKPSDIGPWMLADTRRPRKPQISKPLKGGVNGDGGSRYRALGDANPDEIAKSKGRDEIAKSKGRDEIAKSKGRDSRDKELTVGEVMRSVNPKTPKETRKQISAGKK